MRNGTHKVFNFQVLKLDTKLINEKPNEGFNKLDSAKKIKTPLGFFLRSVGAGVY